MSTRNGIWGAVCALALVTGLAWFWTRGDAGTAPAAGAAAGARRNQTVAVETVPVQTTTLRALRQLSGTLRAGSQFEIAPKVAGRLEQLAVDIGDPVRSGDVVARLDDDEHVQQVDQARAELGVAKAGLAEAQSLLSVKRRQHERMRQLHTQQVASEAQLEAAQVEAEAQQARMQVARAQVTQREAALRGAEVRLAYTVLRASWSGGGSWVVAERFANQGDLLAANAPVLSVVELDTLTAVVFAAERDYPRLQVGQPATVLADAFPGRTFAGRIERMAPVFREASRQARIEVRVENPQRVLKPGMFTNVEVELERAEGAVAVPVEAVVNRGGRAGVFLADVEARVARFIPVRTGIAEGERVQVLDPPLSGQVVTLGNHLLSDGVSIMITNAPAAATGAPAREAESAGNGKSPAGGSPGAARKAAP